MSTNFSDKTRSAIALFALMITIFIGVVGVWFTVLLVKMVVAKHWFFMGFAAAAYAVGTILMLCEAGGVLIESGRGPMPVAMSRRRPLGWAAIAAILIGLVTAAAALVVDPR